jgi:hypothetical protein
MTKGSLVKGYQDLKKMLFCFLQSRKTLIFGYIGGLCKAPEDPLGRSPRESEKPQNVQNCDIRFFLGGGLDSVLVTVDLCV